MSKVVVITGAGIGLGRALARRFAGEGERVVLLGRTLDKVQSAAEEIGKQAHAIQCDVASADSVRAAFAQIQGVYEQVHVLINNAAVFEPSLIAEASDRHVLDTVLINLAGAIFCSRAAIPLMRRGAHIINVSSESVETLHLPHMLVYQSSKAGLERFTLGLHRELEPHGIRVSNVRAGAMMEQGKVWSIPPEARMKFGAAALAAGIDLRGQPLTQFTSVTQVFRSLIDLPEDLHSVTVTLHARKGRE